MSYVTVTFSYAKDNGNNNNNNKIIFIRYIMAD